MSKVNPFQRPLDSYKFDLDYIEGYVHQNATILAKKLNKPYDEIRIKIEAIVKEKYKERTVVLYKKDLKTLDMEETTMPLSRFIGSIEREKLTLAPSFTCYTKVDYQGNKWISMHSKWTDVNKKSRNVFKAKSKEYEAIGDTDNHIINNTLNIASKVKNNSLSGKYALLKYPTSRHSSHYSLTSFTRTVTSTANTISESIVMGNRLYYAPSDVMRHIAATLAYTDMDKVKLAIDKYDLKLPTVKDVLGMILYNTYYYWRSETELDKIKSYLDTLTGIELAAYLYTFDLYHLHKLNKKLVESLLTSLSKTYDHISDDMNIVTSEEDYKINLLHHVCYDKLKGHGISHKEFHGTELAKTLASTMININSVLGKATEFIEAFFQSKVIPPNSSNIKDAIRRAIVLSDTDSTVSFYYHYIVEKYGLFELNNDSIAYAASTSVFVSETIRNVLVQLGKNMNVDEEVMNEIDMKSEYMFSTFVPTHGSKHYIEKTIIKELIQKIDDISFHGVSLIATKMLSTFNAHKEKMVHDIITDVEAGKPINLSALVEFIKTLEREIIGMVERADPAIFMFSDIKEAIGYKKPSSSPYYHYMLWRDVFADKYGDVEAPPYLAMKINVSIGSPKIFQTMINGIADRELAQRWADFYTKYPKLKMSQIIVPYDIVKNEGLPKEIVDIVDMNNVVTTTLKPFYTFMETLGVVSRDNILYLEQF